MPVQELMLTMRDGVKLQNFLHLPPGDGPFLALMARCMYGTEKVENAAKTFNEHGFAVLAQNVRGRHKSEGGPTGRGDFPEDGYDTIDWMVKQPWCSGRVGTFGGSALARVQTATAFLAHPAHRAMCPQVLPYGMMSRLGGATMFHQVPMWFFFAQSGPELNPYDKHDWMPHLFKLPQTSALDGLGGPLELYRDVVADPLRNYWSTANHARFAKLDTPNLMVTGWYDHCGTGPIDFYLHTMQHGTEQQKRNTHLVIGPWDHGSDGDAAREYDFGPASKRDHRAAEIAFFTRHLKADESVPAPAPVRIFVMGRNAWRDEQEFPPKRAAETKLYLHSEGNVRGAWTRGGLSFEAPGEQPPDRFVYDPADPVPSWGGANSGPARVLPMKRGPRDQRVTLYRHDVLAYFSAPLAEPLEVTGNVRLVLFAASSALDTDFTAKLMDVAPDGDARLVCDGVVRARYRKGFEKAEFLTPGQIERYEIDLWFTSNEFQAGHRIALAVSSSNFPRIGRNLNTGGNNETDSHFVSAHQTVFHDTARPSHLLLPVVKGA